MDVAAALVNWVLHSLVAKSYQKIGGSRLVRVGAGPAGPLGRYADVIQKVLPCDSLLPATFRERVKRQVISATTSTKSLDDLNTLHSRYPQSHRYRYNGSSNSQAYCWRTYFPGYGRSGAMALRAGHMMELQMS